MTREELKQKRAEVLKFQKELTRKPSCVCIARYNTILALRNSETKEITHLVVPKERNGLLVLSGHRDELYVPRFEPDVAKQWLKEIDAEYNKSQEQVQSDCGYHFEKCLLSEKQLNQAILKQVKNRAEFLRVLNKMSDNTLSRF